MKKITQKRGFTLIELLLVISIMGVLSSIVLQSLKSSRDNAYNTTRLSNIDQIQKALELYLTKTEGGAGLPSISGGYDCIGINTPLTCWASSQITTGTNTNTNVNLALEGNISEIPKDPSIPLGTDGDYYLYIKTTNSGSTQFPSGPGAYIHWYSKSIGSTPCGRGYKIWGTDTRGYQRCGLFLGNI